MVLKQSMCVAGSSPFFSDDSITEILSEIKLVLKTGRLTDGPKVEEFERQFAAYNNCDFAVGVSSGTAALDVALRYFRLKGREVIVPTNTFVSTPNAVIFAGGKPVFADMNAESLGIDVEDVKRKVTARTAGVIVVHVAGLICPQIDELKSFCQEQGLFLLEDCAHAHGGTKAGKKAGTFGDAGCYSFYPTKVMTSCEGGMILTNNKQLAEEAKCLRTCGQNAERLMVMLGYNWRLNEILAVIGKHQLAYLEEFLVKRNEVAKWYEEALSNVSGVSLFKVPSDIRHSYYKYPVRLADGINRKDLSVLLKEKHGVETGHVYYPPCHLHPFYMQMYGTKEGDFPISEQVLKQVMCLPMHYGLTRDHIEYVAKKLGLAIKSMSNSV